jgi:ATP-dependent Clp protease ATP-binding subunit ClpA
MFERFTDGARAVVVNALERARGEDAVEVREEHLLAAVLAAPSVRPLLAQLGMSGDPTVSVLAEVRGARRRGGLSGVDAHALAGLGIDLDAVVSRVEAELGTGALDDSQPRARRWRSMPTLSARCKLALHSGLRQAVARGDRDLRVEHLLLGLLVRPGLVADVLGGHGITVATVSTALDTIGSAHTGAPRE